jgi:hypothetical protein
MSTGTRVEFWESDKPAKKLKAVFSFADGRKKTVHFGARGMSDYTLHKDPERKARYMARHVFSEHWDRFDTAGALSRWVLWNKPTLAASIADYKKRFKLR